MAFVLKPSLRSGFKKGHSWLEKYFFSLMKNQNPVLYPFCIRKMNLRIFGGFEIRMLFFLLTPLFESYLREYTMCTVGRRVANVTPLYVATPTFL